VAREGQDRTQNSFRLAFGLAAGTPQGIEGGVDQLLPRRAEVHPDALDDLVGQMLRQLLIEQGHHDLVSGEDDLLPSWGRSK
jgi:hypothetical protein